MTSINFSRLKINEVIEKGIFGDEKGFSGIYDKWELVCVLEGSVNTVTEQNVYKLVKNQIVFLPPDEFHSIKGEENCRFIYISFKGEGASLENLRNKAAAISEKDIYFAEELCQLINIDDDIVFQQFCSFAEFFMLRFVAADEIEPRHSHKDAIIYTKAAAILTANISKQISVEELSEELDISVSHLKRVFSKFALTGVHEYYTALKIAKAKELLLQGVSVTETAELTGFANQGYFSAAFKRITDMTPKEFSGKTATTPKQPKKITKTRRRNSMPDYLL